MLKDSSKPNQELIKEISALKQRIQELEQLESDRKRAEETLRKSEEKFRTIFDKASDGILIADVITKKFLQGNAAICSMLGYAKEEIASLTIYDIHPPNDISHILDEFEKQAQGEKVLAEDLPVLRKDGSIFYADIGSSLAIIGGVHYLIGIFSDITERKKAWNAQRYSEERYRELTDFLPISISTFEVDAAGSIISYNRTALETFRYNEEDFKKGLNALQFFAPEDWQRVGESMGKVIQGTSTPGQEFTFLRKDGSKFIGLIYASPNIHQNKIVGIRGVIIDITERKCAEEQIRRQSKLLAAINDVFFKTLSADSEEAVARTCLMEAQEITNSKFGFIGEITSEGLFTITALTDPGWEACRIAETQANALIKDMVIRGIWGQVILKEQSLIVNDPVSYPDRVGIPEGHPPLTSFLGVPLKDQGKVIGMIAMANRGSGYTTDHQQDMEALSVAFVEAIRRKQAEKNLQETLASLRKAFGTTIQVMVSAVEARDPYTSGHQIRSADLARTIATDMGLPPEKIDAIRMAGSIHDIGKLSIPAEILSKPTKLSELEFSLIKEHASRGFEILKGVESPWPLAEIVYQHHERMDGSGYPRKLKGEEILLEARILAVADVVEAMASHRPYRPGLGINVALNEIEKNRGILYDSAVADACLRLFREKGFQLVSDVRQS